MAVPLELLQNVNEYRGVCIWHNTPGGCRKARKCVFHHERGSTQNTYRMPHMSRHRNDDGIDQVVVRPPLSVALQAVQKSWGGVAVTDPDLAGTAQFSRIGMHTLVTFSIPMMDKPDFKECSANELRGYYQYPTVCHGDHAALLIGVWVGVCRRRRGHVWDLVWYGMVTWYGGVWCGLV